MNKPKPLLPRQDKHLAREPLLTAAIPLSEKQLDTSAIAKRALASTIRLGALLCLLTATPARAFVNSGSLDVILAPFPDIFVEQINVDYAAGGGLNNFTASGIAQNIKLLAGTNPISSGTFSLTATIDNAGEATAGNLTIAGTTAGLISPLLTADLTGFFSEFGAGASNQLQFLFSNLSGSAANLYGGNTASAGIILNNSGYQGTFANNFSDVPIFGVGGANADVAPQNIPEPGPLMLVLAGFLFLCAWGGGRV